MSDFQSRNIPGVNFGGTIRGGGSESIRWTRNGPLLIQREFATLEGGYPLTSYQAHNRVYSGSADYLSGVALTDSQVRALGTTALANTNPSSPSVSLLTSAGEITNDGLPNPLDFLRWKNTCRDILRKIAQDHVAIQFAWLPLIGEIRAYMQQVEKSDQILQAAKRRSMKDKIRVGYSFPSDIVTASSYGTSNSILWLGNIYTGDLAPCSRTYRNESRVWFEAEYLNFLPITPAQYDASRRHAHYARYVLGLDMSPAFLWELAPWSWAVDWVTNFGDVLASVSNSLVDGMVMRNGFVMHHFMKETEVKCHGPHWSPFGGNVFGPTRTFKRLEVKKRFPAVPYFGFGTVGDLSARQLSILAALGISKLA